MAVVESVEVRAYAAWLLSFVVFSALLVWSLVPDNLLLSCGITYLPNKVWALTLPAWCVVAVTYIVAVYESSNQSTVPAEDSLRNVHDSHCKHHQQLGLDSVTQGQDGSVLPLLHIPPTVVSRVLYARMPVQEALGRDEAAGIVPWASQQ